MKYRGSLLLLLACTLATASGCATPPQRPTLPKRPTFETVSVLTTTVQDETGAVLQECWLIRDVPAWKRNQAKVEEYVDALEMACGVPK